jgi:hypothetical protein
MRDAMRILLLLSAFAVPFAHAGTFSFTITVTDGPGYPGSQAFQIVIASPSGEGGSYTFLT